MNATIPQQPTRHAHCEFCGGKGDSLKAEVVRSAVGTLYRIPESHVTCKQSALSLSLSLSMNQRPINNLFLNVEGEDQEKE